MNRTRSWAQLRWTSRGPSWLGGDWTGATARGATAGRKEYWVTKWRTAVDDRAVNSGDDTGAIEGISEMLRSQLPSCPFRVGCTAPCGYELLLLDADLVVSRALAAWRALCIRALGKLPIALSIN